MARVVLFAEFDTQWLKFLSTVVPISCIYVHPNRTLDCEFITRRNIKLFYGAAPDTCAFPSIICHANKSCGRCQPTEWARALCKLLPAVTQPDSPQDRIVLRVIAHEDVACVAYERWNCGLDARDAFLNWIHAEKSLLAPETTQNHTKTKTHPQHEKNTEIHTDRDRDRDRDREADNNAGGFQLPTSPPVISSSNSSSSSALFATVKSCLRDTNTITNTGSRTNIGSQTNSSSKGPKNVRFLFL